MLHLALLLLCLFACAPVVQVHVARDVLETPVDSAFAETQRLQDNAAYWIKPRLSSPFLRYFVTDKYQILDPIKWYGNFTDSVFVVCVSEVLDSVGTRDTVLTTWTPRYHQFYNQWTKEWQCVEVREYRR